MTSLFKLLEENRDLKQKLDEALMLVSQKNEEIETLKNHYADILADASETMDKANQLLKDYADYLESSDYVPKHARRFN